MGFQNSSQLLKHACISRTTSNIPQSSKPPQPIFSSFSPSFLSSIRPKVFKNEHTFFFVFFLQLTATRGGMDETIFFSSPFLSLFNYHALYFIFLSIHHQHNMLVTCFHPQHGQPLCFNLANLTCKDKHFPTYINGPLEHLPSIFLNCLT